ncbi:MAG: hypothetical protein U1E17_08005 [Geminicoccaceae bacterium]
MATITAAAGASGLPALDVEELLGAEIGPQIGLGHDILGQTQGGRRRHHRVAAMGDVGEQAAMDEGGRALQRLHEVGCQRIAQEHGHRPLGLEGAGRRHRPPVARVADHDPRQPGLEIGQVAREDEKIAITSPRPR